MNIFFSKTDSNGNPVSAEHRISNEQEEALRRADTMPEESASGKDSDRGGTPRWKKTEKGSIKVIKVPASQPESTHPMKTRRDTQEERVAGGARVATGSG
jgi:hypothetical protein